MAIPLMLITLGVAIARLRPRALGRAFWLCLVKLAICTAVPLAVGLAFGLPRLALGVLVLQVAPRWRSPPTCSRRSTDARPDEVAGLVVVSTLVSDSGDPDAFSLLCLSFPLALRPVFGMLAEIDVRQDTASS